MSKLKYYLMYGISDLIIKIKRYKFYIDDYERLEYDYARVLCHATNHCLSKTDYDVDFVCGFIDDQQQEYLFGCYSDDIKDIIDLEMSDEEKIEEIKGYINYEN